MTILSYRPWIPKPGLGGEAYRQFVTAYGNPNSYGHTWPEAVLEAVCERGGPVNYSYNQYGSDKVYMFNPRNWSQWIPSKDIE